MRTLIWLSLALLVGCGGRYRVGDDDQGAQGGAAVSGGAGGAPSASATAGSAQAGRGGEPPQCPEQRQSYLDYREQVLIDQVAVADPCQTSDDCTLFSDTTGCGVSCGTAIPSAANRGIVDRLYAFAEMNCDPECHVDPPQNCMQRPAAVCIAGRCQ